MNTDATKPKKEFIVCPQCDGADGWFEDVGEWHECEQCAGRGGLWQLVADVAEPITGPEEGTK